MAPPELKRRPFNWQLWVGALASFLYAAAGIASLFDLPAASPYPVPDQAFLLPGVMHWLGTDGNGRDLAGLAMASALTGLLVTGGAALLGLMLALPLGLLAATWPRLAGCAAEGSGGLWLVAAPLPAAILATAAFGPHAAIAAGAIGLANFGQSVRLIHRGSRALRTKGFVAAARRAGMGEAGIAWRHLLPNVAPALLVMVLAQLADGLLWEATLSFLGLGAGPLRPSLGHMLAEVRATLPGHLWEAILAGVLLALGVTSLRLLSGGLARRPNVAPEARGRKIAAA